MLVLSIGGLFEKVLRNPENCLSSPRKGRINKNIIDYLKINIHDSQNTNSYGDLKIKNGDGYGGRLYV